MTPDAFRDSALGPLSSHPHWLRRRWRWCLLLAFLPVAAFVLFLSLFLADLRNWLPMLLHARAWVAGLAAALAATLGALMTLALSARWAELQRRARPRGGSGAERLGVDFWVVGLALLLGVAGALLARAPWVPPAIRFGFHLFAVLPILAILLGMCSLRSPADEDRAPGRRRRPIWLLLALAAGAVLALTVAYDIGVALQQTWLSRVLERWLPSYASLKRPFLGLLTLGPATFLLFALWQLWRAATPRPETSEAEAPDAEGRHRPPMWLNDLLAHLPEGCRCPGEPRRVRAAETSPLSKRADLDLVFSGSRPTEDQATVFGRFIASYHEVLGEGGAGETGEAEEPSADLLLEGEPGSGKTATVLACALYAAFVRGQRVLFLVPDALRQKVVKERVDAFLKRAHLHYYVRAGVVNEPNVHEWLSAGRPAQGEGAAPVVPHILIGTADAVEKHLYGLSAGVGGPFECLKRLLFSIEVIIVDDLLDFEDAQRSHLPFMLDKQRLLLASEYLPLQVVVTCPRLARIGRNLLGTRLFTEKRLKLQRNVLTLRPRPSRPAWRVDLHARDVAAAAEALALWCLKRQDPPLDVVLYRAGIDERERTRQQAELAREGGDRITVLADLDQPLQCDPLGVDAIFYHVAADQDVCLALRLRMGSEDTVLFSLMPEGEERESLGAGIIPVVAERSAVPLQTAHACSVLRFLRPDAPVSAATWQQFGLGYGGLDSARPVENPEVVLDVDEWNEESYAAKLWPYIALRERSQMPSPVDVRRLPHPRYRFYLSPGRRHLFLGRVGSAEAPAEGSARAWHAAWLTQAGKLPEQADLAHLRALRLVYGSEVYAPDTIRRTPHGIEIATQPWQGNGMDAYLPVLDVRWDLAPTGQAEPLGGGVDYGLRWFNLGLPAPGTATMHAVIKGLMTEYGFVSPIQSVPFSYPALLAGIVFDPRHLDPDRLSETIGKALAGHWATGADTQYWPALTSAMNYAFSVRIPGLSYFARFLAFRLAGDAASQIGAAVGWLVEPWDAGRTGMRVLSRLLGDPHERIGLLKSVEWFLLQLCNAASPTRFARRFSRQGFEGDENLQHVQEGLALARGILRRAEDQVGAVAAARGI